MFLTEKCVACLPEGQTTFRFLRCGSGQPPSFVSGGQPDALLATQKRLLCIDKFVIKFVVIFFSVFLIFFEEAAGFSQGMFFRLMLSSFLAMCWRQRSLPCLRGIPRRAYPRTQTSSFQNAPETLHLHPFELSSLSDFMECVVMVIGNKNQAVIRPNNTMFVPNPAITDFITSISQRQFGCNGGAGSACSYRLYIFSCIASQAEHTLGSCPVIQYFQRLLCPVGGI